MDLPALRCLLAPASLVFRSDRSTNVKTQARWTGTVMFRDCFCGRPHSAGWEFADCAWRTVRLLLNDWHGRNASATGLNLAMSLKCKVRAPDAVGVEQQHGRPSMLV